MNKFVIAHIDAHMTEGLLHGVKEHQVTWFEFSALNAFCHLGLVGRFSRQNESNGLLENGSNKATAIKARVDVGAPRSVRHTQKTHRADHQIGRFFAHELTQIIQLL